MKSSFPTLIFIMFSQLLLQSCQNDLPRPFNNTSYIKNNNKNLYVNSDISKNQLNLEIQKRLELERKITKYESKQKQEQQKIDRDNQIPTIFAFTKKNGFTPVGFVVGSKNIYLTTSKGRLFTVDVETGKTKSIIKIDNHKISRPFILNKNLFLVKDNSIIKLD